MEEGNLEGPSVIQKISKSFVWNNSPSKLWSLQDASKDWSCEVSVGLPLYSKIHPVFHVALSKKVIHLTLKSQPLPGGLTEGLELNLFLEAMLDCIINEGGQQEILVKWKQLSKFESSWEEVSVIAEDFPQFHLEHRMTLDGSGIVRTRPPITKVYERRNKEERNTTN